MYVVEFYRLLEFVTTNLDANAWQALEGLKKGVSSRTSNVEYK